MNSILERIGDYKQQEVAAAKAKAPLASFDLKSALPVRDFIKGLEQQSPAIIAEIKKASPSKGVIRPSFDVISIAKEYEENGASCISVLTDVHFFQGDPSFLALAKTQTHLPILRKDFIIDPYQIYESRALGADCILLIVAMLDDKQLRDYCQLAQELNMAVLVESHTLAELERALQLPTPLMGINNRNLHTFETNVQLSLDMKQYLPPNKLLITESGINSPQDIQLMQQHGINTFLIGESLMREENIGAKLQQLMVSL